MPLTPCWSAVRQWVPLSVLLLSTTTPLVRCLSPTAAGSVAAAARKIVKNVAVPGLQNGMDYIKLGDSDLTVSKVCMGTMTFGQQNTLEEGAAQLHRAHDHYGINFLDTAEVYPVPPRPETQGLTDRAVARFLKERSAAERDGIVVATKVVGRSDRVTWLPRPGHPAGTPASLTRRQIVESVEASLERLGVNCIDLLQFHWPDRYTGGIFGSPDFNPDAYENAPMPVAFEEQLEAVQKLIQQGKVRYLGVSNETPFGICRMSQLAMQAPELYPKIVSIQNCYSLVMRKDFEAGLAEACYHNRVGLLAYSPLAGGSLSGKYRDTANIPPESRLKLFPGFMDRYLGSLNEAAVNAYGDVATAAGLTPVQLALSFCYHSPLVASTIVGATSMQQLEENLQAYDIRLDDTLMKEMHKTYLKYTDPTKN